jgi:hypothetical protein
VNISKVRDSLLHLPEVDTADVLRQMPDRITINISERQPVACVTEKPDDNADQDTAFLMDANGFLMKNHKHLPAYYQLPVIYGVQTSELEEGQALRTPEVKAALDLIRLNAADTALQARFQAMAIDVSKGYCLVVTDRSHARITFSLDRLEWQFDRLMTLFDNIEPGKREIQTVNLMVQRNIPVTFMPTEEEKSAAEARALAAKTEKPVPDKTSPIPSKKSQSSGQKKSVPVKKAHAVKSDPDQATPVKKAIPLNTSTAKPNGQ